MHLKKYYEEQNYDELFNHIKEKYEQSDYHSVILYYPIYNNIKKNIIADIMYYYSMAKLNYYENIKEKLNNDILEIVEYFLTNRFFDLSVLFKLLIYCKIKISTIVQYVPNFEKELYDNKYYNLYYLLNKLELNDDIVLKNNIYELLSQMEEDTQFNDFVKKNILLNNNDSGIGNFERYHNSYKKNDVEIICYNEENVMASCNIVKIKNEVIIIDCGAMIIDDKDYKIDIRKFLNDNNIEFKMIKGVFITHAHLDHYGSLDYFEHTGIPVFMTSITRDLILKSQDIIRLNNLNINIISENAEYKVGDFKIRGIRNGHIIGSLAYIIKNEYTILCSGDILLENQNTVPGFDLSAINEPIDILLCESTYGKRSLSIKREDSEIMLSKLLDDSLKCGLNVFIPAFAIGRSQEIIAIKNKYNIPGLMIIDGLSKVITKYYEEYSSCKKLYNLDIIENNGNIDNINFNIPKIVVASSGMMNRYSTFYKKYFDKVMNAKCVVLKTGYIEYGNYALDEILRNYNVNFYNISLSAHASHADLIKFINYIKPTILITNHGSGIDLN